MWFVLALTALLFWSGSDLFSKIGSKPDDKLSHWKMVMAVGLVMGLHACYEIFVGGVPISFDAIITYLPASLLYIVSMLMGYIALRYIELSVSSPICNCSGAIAAIFLLIFLNEAPAPLMWVGIALVGVGMISLGAAEMSESDEIRAMRQQKANVKYAKSWIALILPVLYCFLDAAGTVADGIILDGTLSEDVANVAYELTFLAMGIGAAIYVLLIKRDKITIPREGPKLLGGICETAGQFAYIYALGDEVFAGPAAAIISCYCALAVVWSRIFLKEKLSWKHYAAIAIAICGIVVLGFADP